MEATTSPSYLLLEERGKVFETSVFESSFFVTDPLLGKRVYLKNRELDEITVSGYLVLPRRPPAGGRVNLLTVGRSRRKRSAPFTEEPGGVFLIVAYDTGGSLLEFDMNVGRDSAKLVTVSAKKVPWAALSGRVFQLFVEISRNQVFASINEAFSDGDLFFDVMGQATGGELRPWGNSPWGRWSVAIGLANVAGARFAPLPPGLGLSDLQIAFGSEEDDEPIPLDYSGGLDHLVTRGRLLRFPSSSVSGPSAAEEELSALRRLLDCA